MQKFNHHKISDLACIGAEHKETMNKTINVEDVMK